MERDYMCSARCPLQILCMETRSGLTCQMHLCHVRCNGICCPGKNAVFRGDGTSATYYYCFAATEFLHLRKIRQPDSRYHSKSLLAKVGKFSGNFESSQIV